MRTGAVIPRLAKRAEGPHSRRLRYREISRVFRRIRLAFRGSDQPPARSLAVSAARDDRILRQCGRKKRKGALVSESALHFDGDKPNSVAAERFGDAMIIYLDPLA